MPKSASRTWALPAHSAQLVRCRSCPLQGQSSQDTQPSNCTDATFICPTMVPRTSVSGGCAGSRRGSHDWFGPRRAVATTDAHSGLGTWHQADLKKLYHSRDWLKSDSNRSLKTPMHQPARMAPPVHSSLRQLYAGIQQHSDVLIKFHRPAAFLSAVGAGQLASDPRHV